METRRQAHQPEMSDRIAPFVRNVMINETDHSSSFHDSRVLALGRLSEGGALSEQPNSNAAMEALQLKESARAGKDKSAVVTFGAEMKCTD